MHIYCKPLSIFNRIIITVLLFGMITVHLTAQQTIFGSHAGITKSGSSQALTGSAIVAGAHLLNDFSSTINLSPDAAAMDNNQPSTIEHVITLSLNDIYVIPQGFKAAVSFNVFTGATATDALNSTAILQNQLLTVDYDPAAGVNHNAKQYIYFKENYTAPECVVVVINSITIQIITHTGGTVTTTNITQLPGTSIDARNAVRLENKIEPTYYYNLKNNALPYQFSVPSQVVPNNGIVPDEMFVSWNWVDSHGNSDIGNNYTQLEWTWLEDDMADVYTVNDVINTGLLFKNNATRVDLPPIGIKYYDKDDNNNTVTRIGYKIPLLYDGTGHIYCRIRAVNVHADGSIQIGPWCTTNMSNDATPGATAATSFAGHNNNLNWQVTTSYAEDGKRKSVVQYFDGGLRSRQTVTKDNSTNTTVTAETLYDKQGRPAIQILPTPGITGVDNVIAYQQNLNLFNGQGAGTDPSDMFDLTAVNQTPALSASSGSSKYYSHQNADLVSGTSDDGTKNIPDAGGYPYTQTKYTPDGTGRVAAQGGVGQDFQLGSTRETKYFYGKPLQEELDGLFGTEVGEHQHYFKNMVMDANKQVSVSYIDMHGRTIATALAGDAPAGMSSLNNTTDYPNQQGQGVSPLTSDLLINGGNIQKGHSLESLTTILVPTSGSYTFTYTLPPATVTIPGCNGDLTYTPKYDLEITMVDEETGNPVKLSDNTTPFDIILRGINTPDGNPTLIYTTNSLGVGSYSVRKTLTLREDLLQQDMQDYLKTNNGVCKSLKDLINEVFTAMKGGCDVTGNVPSTNFCLELGVNNGQDYKQQFANNYLNNLGINPLNATTAQIADANAAADAAFTVAQSHCVSASPTVSHRLADIEQGMLNDMTPYSGQYATNPAQGAIISPVTGTTIAYGTMFNKYNIFAVTGGAHTPQPYYQTPLNGNYIPTISAPLYTSKSYYFDADGLQDALINPVGETPAYTLLNALSPDGFAQEFKASWAKALLPYHPEYAKLQFAKTVLSSSYDWIDGGDFAQASTMQAAISKGLINSIITNTDPFFAISAVSAQKGSMNTYLNHFWKGSDVDGKRLTMWQMAYGNVKCLNEATDEARAACYENAPYPPVYGTLTPVQSAQWTALITNADQTEADLVWNNFKTFYQSVRDGMVNAYIDAASPVADDETLIAQGFLLHFPKNNDQAIEQTGGTASSSSDANPNHWYIPGSNYAPNTTAAAAQQANHNSNVVAGYATIWRNELLENTDFAVTTKLPANQLDKLLNLIITGSVTDDGHDGTANGGFMGICKLAINDAHPDGATNLKAGSIGILDVDNTYSTTFEQVFNKAIVYARQYLGASTEFKLGVYCNPYVIEFPKPYGATPDVTDRLTGAVDDCMCSEYAAKISEAGSSVLNSAGVVDFTLLNQYLTNNQQQNITRPLFDALQHCGSLPAITVNPTNGNNSDGGGSDLLSSGGGNPTDDGDQGTVYHQYTLTVPQPLPGFLVCGFSGAPECLTCSAVNTNSNDFVKLFGLPDGYTTVPLLPAGTNVLTQQEIDYNVLYARYLNYKTGMQQSWNDYQNALDNHPGCTVTICQAGTIPLSIIVSDPVTQPAEGYFASLSIDLVPGFDYAVTNTATALQLTIDPTATACGDNSNKDVALLCPVTRPLTDGTDIIQPQDPCRHQYDQASATATHRWEEQYNLASTDFVNTYLQSALTPRESFTVSYQVKEFHYTLYYYNMAGSLVKTVPPKGATPDYSNAFLTSVKNARTAAAGNGGDFPNPAITPDHKQATNYRYNSLGQVVAQNTPDAGTSLFWYDALGRLVVSQNAKQAVADGDGNQRYSYTLYDQFGRITEVGEKPQSVAMSQDIAQNSAAANPTNPQACLADWLAGDGSTATVYNKEQITRTTYDVPYGSDVEGASVLTPYLTQYNLRNRVSYSEVFNLEPDNMWRANVTGYPDGSQSPTTFTPGVRLFHASATYYTYDIHGNVNVLLQDYGNSSGTVNVMNQSGNRFKRMQYDYDLISGKVNQVAYQAPFTDGDGVYHQNADAVYHRYSYDAENRLTSVETSRDDVYYERDAAYNYYRHGPLMQTQLGNVQELNYTYTLQGWLKSVNAGWEGSSPVASTGYTAPTALGFSLHYYSGDYRAIGQATGTPTTDVIFNGIGSIDGTGDASLKPLYNGNIAAMAVNISQLAVTNTGSTGKPLVYHYGYDQLNRLVNMDAFSSANNTFASLTKLQDEEYHEHVTYDPNGNIMTYLRNGNTGNTQMDKLSYRYDYYTAAGVHKTYDPLNPAPADADRLTNHLNSISDEYGAHTGMGDIGNQNTDNYQYDEIGNLIKNTAENITNISWTVYGKIGEIDKTNPDGSTTIVKYAYDVAGNRVSKTVGQSSGATEVTWYVRDATGNVMGIYSAGNGTVNSGNLTQIEAPVYGSSRLGEIKFAVNVAGTNLFTTPAAYIGTGTNEPVFLATFTRGQKIFELSNHLGNVLATVSDKLVATAANDANSNSIIDGTETFTADVITAQDYYPGGSIEPGRSFNAGSQYRYGFNGKENDNDIESGAQDYGMRIYDSRIVRFLSVDPLTPKYPELTPYQFASNNPVSFIDEDGLEAAEPPKEGDSKETYKFSSTANGGSGGMVIDQTLFYHAGSKDYGTKAGWYSGEDYIKVIDPMAKDFAGYAGLYNPVQQMMSNAKNAKNWNAEERNNMPSTSLGHFLNRSFGAEGFELFEGAAVNHANHANAFGIGYAPYSPFNVEDIIGLGQLVKGVFFRPKFVSFFSVQSEENATRLLAGGEPWPIGPSKAHLGPGLYSWGTKAEAQAYLNSFTKYSPGLNLKIMEFSVSKMTLSNLKYFEVPMNDAIANKWLAKYSSLYGEGLPHGYDYIKRSTGMGMEHYFTPRAFSNFKAVTR